MNSKNNHRSVMFIFIHIGRFFKMKHSKWFSPFNLSNSVSNVFLHVVTWYVWYSLQFWLSVLYYIRTKSLHNLAANQCTMYWSCACDNIKMSWKYLLSPSLSKTLISYFITLDHISCIIATNLWHLYVFVSDMLMYKTNMQYIVIAYWRYQSH